MSKPARLSDRLTALTALGWLLAAKLLHLTRPTPALLRRLRRPAQLRSGAQAPGHMRWALSAVSRRLPWRSDCLIQSLAGKLWLDARGVPCALRLGVRRDDAGGLSAHAWIEVDGVPVTGGPPDPALSPLIPGSADR